MLRSLAALALLLAAAPLAAQDLGAIAGRVLDAQRAPVEGVNVLVEGTDRGDATDADGRFAIASVAAGERALVVSAVGFETAREAVAVRAGATARVEVVLRRSDLDAGEVVVTARESLTGRGVRDLVGSAHAIGPRELERQAHTDVHRVLRAVPGVQIQEEDGYGLRPNIGLRGTGTERSSRVTLMEDGVLIAPAPYAAPAAYYVPSVGRMDGVEVRKGASQVRYGPYTTGGAINLLPARVPPAREARADVLVGGDARRTLHLRAGDTWATGVLGGLRVGAVVEGFVDNADGFKTLQGPAGRLLDDADTGFDKRDGLARVRLASGPSAAVVQALTLTGSTSREDSRETYLGLTAGDFAATPLLRYAGSQEDRMEASQHVLRARHVAVFSPRLDVTTTLYRHRTARNWYKLDKVRDGLADDADGDDARVGIASILARPERYADELAVVRGDLGGAFADGRLYVKANNRRYLARGVQSVVGVRVGAMPGAGLGALVETGLRLHADEEDRFQWVDGYAAADGALTRVESGTPGTESNRVTSARAAAGFVQAEVEAGRLTLTPGVRVEHVRFARDDYGRADPARTGADLSTRSNLSTAVIPGLGAAWRASAALTVFGGVHRGYAPPGTTPDAEPEASVNAEAGVRIETAAVGLQAVAYRDAYSNLLGSDLAAAGGTGSGDAFNGGAVDVRGAELSATADLAPLARLGGWALPVRVAAAWTDARFEGAFESEFDGWGSVAAGDALPYVSPWTLFAQLGVERGPLRLDVSASAVAPTRAVAGQGPIPDDARIDGRLVLDVSAEAALARGVALFGTVRNATDARYVAARRPAGLRPGLPRTVGLGLRTRL